MNNIKNNANALILKALGICPRDTFTSDMLKTALNSSFELDPLEMDFS